MIYHSKPILTEEKERQKRNVQALLFADFSVPPEKALLFLDDMENNPHKVAKYCQLVMLNLSKQYETVKEKSPQELRSLVRERAGEWACHVGPLTIQDYATMSRQWDIPIDNIINEKVTPELIKKMLDCFVIGQDRYKIKLSVAFYTYLMHWRQSGLFLPKSNLLVCGPSGSGKTYGMQILSKLFHVPFAIIHCNSLVQEGIVGPGLTDSFTSLLSQGWLKEELEHSVVCFDEFDKLFEKRLDGSDSGSYNARVVNEMLNIIDDKGEVEFKETFDKYDAKRIKLKTRKMMFVFTGVFEGLGKNEDKKKKNSIGFHPTRIAENANDIEATIDDFVEFGVKPEIMGRIQNFVFLDDLTVEEMAALFDMGANSPFTEFEQYFNSNGIDTVLTEEGKHALAQLASERGLGVRGLKSLLQQVLLEDMYDLEVGDDNVLRVTKQYIFDNLNK